MRIGVFDSGLGGITLLSQAIRQLPDEYYLFYADTDHVPYGEKTRGQILGYVDESARFMVENGCKALVIGCNTATSVGISHLRRNWPDIPIIGIEPAVKPALTKYRRNGRVLVCATAITINGEKLQHLIERLKGEEVVDKVALPGLVRMAEAGHFEKEAAESYLRGAFAGLDLKSYDCIVLGCTHFNFFKDSFEEMFPGIPVIDGSEAAIAQLRRKMDAAGIRITEQEKEKMKGEPRVVWYESGRKVTDSRELDRIETIRNRWLQLN
ncbi:MAG: glutamate racemase [Lachnospiraceae bacterium]|jgi:glutamate racemase